VSSKIAIPRGAKELDEAARSMGFELVRRAGSGHLIYTKEGIDGMVVVSSSPGKFACKRVRADCRRLIEANGRKQ
jgi:predicted RNA binding protein YcfA (HicA-like mRNA interferase family)